MEDRERAPDDVVRCLACGRTYELPAGGRRRDGTHGCTGCGAASWIALSIPTRERSGPTPGVRPGARHR